MKEKKKFINPFWLCYRMYFQFVTTVRKIAFKILKIMNDDGTLFICKFCGSLIYEPLILFVLHLSGLVFILKLRVNLFLRFIFN